MAFLSSSSQPAPSNPTELRSGLSKLRKTISDYEDLARRLQTLRPVADSDGALQVDERVDLGMGFYCDAVIPDVSLIRINTGIIDTSSLPPPTAGRSPSDVGVDGNVDGGEGEIWLDMTIDEALVFIERKVRVLRKRETSLEQRSKNVEREMKAIEEAFGKLGAAGVTTVHSNPTVGQV